MSRYTTAPTELERPDPDQVARYAGGTGRICGECKHFAHGEGQMRMEQQQLLQSIVRDYGWKLHHLGSAPQDLGLCGESASGENRTSGKGLTFTGRYCDARSCDAFRPANGRFTLANKG
jgi:hypothetical protein